MEPRRVTNMELDSGKYGHILRKNADVQHKILQATVALSNEDGERNRLLRIQLAMELIKMNEIDKIKVQDLIEEDIDLTDQAVE